MKHLTPLILAFLFINSVLNGQSKEEFRAVVEKALEYFDNEQFEESLPYWDQLIRWNPKSELPYLYKARTISAMEDRKGAIEYFNYAQKLNHGNAEIYFYRALNYSLLEIDNKAIDDIKKALELDNENAFYLNHAAGMSMKTGYYERAVKLFERIINKDENAPNKLYFMGFSYFMLNDTINADKCFGWMKKIIDNSEKSIENESLLCGVLLMQGELEKSEKICLSHINRFPENPIGYESLADYYRVTKNFGRALEVNEKAIEYHSSNIYNLINKGYFLMKLDSLESSKQLLDEIIAEYPNSYTCLKTRSELYIKMGQPELIIEDLNRAIENRPGRPGAYKVRAQYYFAINQNEKGCADLNTAISKGYKRMYTSTEADDLFKENCN